MEEQLQLVIRRRRGDGLDGIWLGYDLYLGQKPNGKIVMGWDLDAHGNFTYHYADEPPEITYARKKTEAKLTKLTERPRLCLGIEDFGTPAFNETAYPESSVIDATAYPSIPADFELAFSSDIEPQVRDITTTPAMTGAVERFIVSFDWHYGSEQMILESLDQVVPWRKSVEDKFGDLKPTNWKIRREWVVVEDLPWPG